MRLVALLLLASCAAAPDTVYFEIGEEPLAQLHPVLGDFDEYAFTVGVSWSIQPREVVIVGQQDKPSWLGYSGGITPLLVETAPQDDKALEDLSAEVAALRETAENSTLPDEVSQLTADVGAMRERVDTAGDQWSAMHTALLGGGGLGGFLLFLLTRRKPQDSP